MFSMIWGAVSVCTLVCTQTPLLVGRAPSVSCPLTGAILPVFTHLPHLSLPTVPSTVPCNPEAQCLAATLTTHWTATCCAQSHPPNTTTTTPAVPPPSPPSSDSKTHPTPPCHTSSPTPCLASNHICPCSTQLSHRCFLNYLQWNYLFLCCVYV